MNRQKRYLSIFLAIAALWQALGAFGYMVVLADNPAAPAFYGAVKVIMFALPLIGIALGAPRGAFLRGATRNDALLGLGLGTLFVAALWTVAWLTPSTFTAVTTDALPRLTAFGLSTPAMFITGGIIFSVLHSLFEEYYWRWSIFGGLQTIISPTRAVIASGAAFSLHHMFILAPFVPLPLAIIGGAAVGAVGSLWAYMYYRRGNLAAAWISHIIADLAIISVMYHFIY